MATKSAPEIGSKGTEQASQHEKSGSASGSVTENFAPRPHPSATKRSKVVVAMPQPEHVDVQRSLHMLDGLRIMKGWRMWNKTSKRQRGDYQPPWFMLMLIRAKRYVNSEPNAKRIVLVETCFGSSGQPLAMPHRVLVGEGVLTKMCRKKPKKRQFFLFNDILVYGNIVIEKKKYNKQHVIPLENVKLMSVPDDGPLRNGWQIISPSKSFTVFAATATEKQEWMAHINKCVQDLITKHGKQRTAVEDSPVWVPDSDASKCMHCRRTEFTVINRRHHCRKCGLVVCASCSSKRWLLPEQSSKPLRVCLSCFSKLTISGGNDSELPEPRSMEGAGRDSAGPREDSSGEESSDDDDGPTAPASGPVFYEKN